jgi:hypothetical protein
MVGMVDPAKQEWNALAMNVSAKFEGQLVATREDIHKREGDGRERRRLLFQTQTAYYNTHILVIDGI